MAEDHGQDGFSDAERAAMKERAAELRASKGEKGTKKAEREAQALVDAIAKLPDAERELAQRIDDIVTAVAPELAPKTMYGMPAWAREGKTVLMFQAASKFDTRYSSLSFEDSAALDDGDLWPTAFAIPALTPGVAARVEELVRRAVS